MKIKKDATVKTILQYSFPTYTGRKFYLDTTGSVLLYDTNWGGGSRNYYKFISLNDVMASQNTGRLLPEIAPWKNPYEGERVEIPADHAVVKHAIFQGRDCGVTIFINPANVAKFLPQIETKEN